jgi:hypothetical protein
MHSRGCFQQTTHGGTEELTASTLHMMQCMQRSLQQGRKGANGGGGGVRTEQNKKNTSVKYGAIGLDPKISFLRL